MTAANDSRMSCPWSDCRVRFVVIGALVVAALLLAGCALPPYWKHTGQPRKVMAVLRAKTVTCNGVDSIGCFIPLTGTVLIKEGLSPEVERCVLTHEGSITPGVKSHANGWTHGEGNNAVGTTEWIDCGDGTEVHG